MIIVFVAKNVTSISRYTQPKKLLSHIAWNMFQIEVMHGYTLHIVILGQIPSFQKKLKCVFSTNRPFFKKKVDKKGVTIEKS